MEYILTRPSKLITCQCLYQSVYTKKKKKNHVRSFITLKHSYSSTYIFKKQTIKGHGKTFLFIYLLFIYFYLYI